MLEDVRIVVHLFFGLSNRLRSSGWMSVENRSMRLQVLLQHRCPALVDIEGAGDGAQQIEQNIIFQKFSFGVVTTSGNYLRII